MMRKLIVVAVVALLGLGVGVMAMGRANEPGAKGPMIGHMVYFSLKDNTPEAKAKLVAACKKYLSKHPGEVYFGAGTLAGDLKREVNDTDWDVALHIVFQDRKAHDAYQDAERHKQFIDENKGNWKKVRVFDSEIQP
jgi:hypothetical protein